MKKIFALLFIIWLAALTLAQTNQASASRPLVFTHATVIDMTGAAAKPDMTVVVVGDRIAEIGKSDQVKLPAGAQIVDATGKFLERFPTACTGSIKAKLMILRNRFPHI
jgi:enamidase